MTTQATCAMCGVSGGAELCAYHAVTPADDWATANRIMCDLLHRGIAPVRLAPNDRDDDFWGHSGEAG